MHSYLQVRSLLKSFLMLDPSMFKELGIKTLGEIFAILKLVKEPPNPTSIGSQLRKKHQLQNFPQHFRKFKIDCDVFTKRLTFLSLNRTFNYTIAQRKLPRTSLLILTDFCKLLDILEILGTQKSNPMDTSDIVFFHLIKS